MSCAIAASCDVKDGFAACAAAAIAAGEVL